MAESPIAADLPVHDVDIFEGCSSVAKDSEEYFVLNSNDELKTICDSKPSLLNEIKDLSLIYAEKYISNQRELFANLFLKIKGRNLNEDVNCTKFMWSHLFNETYTSIYQAMFNKLKFGRGGVQVNIHSEQESVICSEEDIKLIIYHKQKCSREAQTLVNEIRNIMHSVVCNISCPTANNQHSTRLSVMPDVLDHCIDFEAYAKSLSETNEISFKELCAATDSVDCQYYKTDSLRYITTYNKLTLLTETEPVTKKPRGKGTYFKMLRPTNDISSHEEPTRRSSRNFSTTGYFFISIFYNFLNIFI